jgi:xanthine/CO dehydrogenase XdhC/CoxF family maturation factor
LAAQRQTAVLVTLFSLEEKKGPQTGTCLLVRANEVTEGRPAALKELLLKEARQVLAGKQSIFRNYITAGKSQAAFIEFIKPVVSLVIAGAGNDVLPLVNMAGILGWQVTVMDGRPALAKKERFAGSCRVMIAKPGKIAELLTIDEYTVFVLMTHNYNYDLAMLRALLLRDVCYVGMLGPRKKIERMLSEIIREGTQLSNHQLESIHSPVGLDLGAENPEEIALSIISEIKAVLSGRQGISLHTNSGAIHSRDEWVNISIEPGEHG